jgi:polyhydroxybutyrate depolymerase
MIALYALILMTVLGPDTLGPGDHNRTITVGNLNRNYLVHIPATYDSKKPMPVVLAFHGGGANADSMVAFSGLNKKSDDAGFIVVYPSGTGRLDKILTFNSGNCCGYAMNNKIDDMEYTRKLLDDLAKSVNIDCRRVYATGMSNGGIMSYLLASELSDRIAAIAPFKGGKGKGPSGTEFYSVEHSIQAWVKANGCEKEPVVTQLPDTAKDGTRITRKTYGSGKDGAEVVLIEIEGGGHTWPGQIPRFKALGKSTKNISANDLMWEFFEKHPMK